MAERDAEPCRIREGSAEPAPPRRIEPVQHFLGDRPILAGGRDYQTGAAGDFLDLDVILLEGVPHSLSLCGQPVGGVPPGRGVLCRRRPGE